MKKFSILIALLIPIMMLFSCEGKKNKPKNTETPQPEVVTVVEPQPETPVVVEDIKPKVAENHGLAFEVFQKIPKEDLDEAYRDNNYTCPEDCTLFFSEGEYENSFEIHCLPYNDGSWLAVYIKEYCFDGCVQQILMYNYKDGELTPIEDILPHAEESDYVDLLREVLTAEEIDPEQWESYDIDYLSWGEIVEFFSFYDDNRVEVFFEYLNSDGLWEAKIPEKYYLWNGKEFERNFIR